MIIGSICRAGMLKEVRTFEVSVFNSELDSNFTNSTPRARAWPGMSRCSPTTGWRPIGGIVSFLLSRRYVDHAAYYWVDVASRSCYAVSPIHTRVNSNMPTVATHQTITTSSVSEHFSQICAQITSPGALVGGVGCWAGHRLPDDDLQVHVVPLGHTEGRDD